MEPQPILIVDGEAPQSEIIAGVVRGLGYSCEVCLQAREAMERIGQKGYGLIFADINLPDLNGFELIEQARALSPDSWFFILTGYSEDYSYERMVQAGARDFLKKPFTVFDLKHRLTRIFKECDLANENTRLLNQQLTTAQKLSGLFESSIRTLSATVDARHHLTAGHSRRVTDYALLIAEEMGLTVSEKEIIKYAALLHDIGKIGISDKVLLKKGLFSPDERREMNTHADKTSAILDQFFFPESLGPIPAVATSHHEKYDGGGYPKGLKGDKIPLGSRILAVADVFDALTSQRDYPKYDEEEVLSCDPVPIPRVVTILEGQAGRHFDPLIVETFLRCLPQALLMHRGGHFPPAYVDEPIRLKAPHLLEDSQV